jgi:thioesterase domain-containing protein
VRAARRFVPGRIEGPVLHIATSKTRADGLLRAESWRPYVDGDIDRHEVTCGHEEMLKHPAVAQVAALLARYRLRAGGAATTRDRQVTGDEGRTDSR